ncbi:MAG: hypothetical protein JEZ00_12960 [Anaerolineaceae bacterium]|nr:hypothetical protein [Anaerolineaceae bacterium]
MQYTYKIENEIFNTIPGYQRGIVLGFDTENNESPTELISNLREAEADLRAQMSLPDILQNPHIAAWRDAYRLAGIKPADFRPSVEGLVRRVLRGDNLPSINCIVDIGTLLSIKYLLPIGAHAIDHLKHGMSLRKATGEEKFEPFGSNLTENPNQGEIIFSDGNQVMTRRWTWRQANHTIIATQTKAVEYNIDALSHISNESIHAIAAETMNLLEKYCHANCRFSILNHENPQIQFNFP